MIGADFWRGKRVFLTGHTGFKGGWLALWLSMIGQTVTVVSVIALGIAPFIAGDIIKTMAAAAVARLIIPKRDYII